MKIFTSRNVTAVGFLIVLLNVFILFVQGTTFNPEGLSSAIISTSQISGMEIVPSYTGVVPLNNIGNQVLSQLYESSPNSVGSYERQWALSNGSAVISIGVISLPNQSDAANVFHERIHLLQNGNNLLSSFGISSVPGASGYNISGDFDGINQSQLIGFSIGRFLIMIDTYDSNIATSQGQEAEATSIAQDEYQLAEQTVPNISLSTRNVVPRNIAIVVSIFLIVFTAFRLLNRRLNGGEPPQFAKLPVNVSPHIVQQGDVSASKNMGDELVGDHEGITDYPPPTPEEYRQALLNPWPGHTPDETILRNRGETE